jgi:hypothetical protein
MPKKKETGTRKPELQEILDALDSYRLELHLKSTVSSTKFSNMQSGLYAAKQIVRDLYGAPRKKEIAWVK